MNWVGDRLLEIRGVRFVLATVTEELQRLQTEKDRFVLGKSRGMVETIHALGRKLNAKRIFEIGIFKGGSTALYDMLFEPTRLVAIDLSSREVPALGDYLRAHRREHAVELHYGVDQGDVERLHRILDAAFRGRTLDLVVDDASHSYAETRASFNAAFPLLRTGGAFVIEDWGWAHWPGDAWQKEGGPWPDKPAMSNLAMELLMACASSAHLIREVRVTPQMLIVERGPGETQPEAFDVSSLYLTRGRPFRLQL